MTRRTVTCADCGRDRPYAGRGLCGACYIRATRRGDRDARPLSNGSRVLTRTWQIDPSWRLDRIVDHYTRALSLLIPIEDTGQCSPVEYDIRHARGRTFFTATVHIGPGFTRWGGRALQPHGTHAAYNRHKARGEQPCEVCIEGERDYGRDRARRRRAAERLGLAGRDTAARRAS